MKKSLLPAIAAGTIMVMITAPTAFAHGEHRHHRNHDDTVTLRMDPDDRHEHHWRGHENRHHGRGHDNWRHGRAWGHRRHSWRHRHDHWAYRPRYRYYDRIRVIPSRPGDHWGLQLFYYD